MVKRFFFVTFAFVSILTLSCNADVIEREGKGYLEEISGQKVLHLKGSPYEQGFQHGKLLKREIQKNIATFIDAKKPDAEARFEKFKQNLPKLLSFVPQEYLEEMRALAQASEVPYEKILSLNLFPEMFHCSGITVKGKATRDGSLYHVRVLDYAIGKNLQESAVLIVSEPQDKHRFMNVGYAGFIGSVTGMNDQKVAVGEIGGQGYGHWNGVPMAFLIREVLESASNLTEAKELFSNSPRTCEYFYIISDGKDDSSTGVYATESQIHFIEPGASYALLAPKTLPANYGKDGEHDKFFLSSCTLSQTENHLVLYDQNKRLTGIYHKQPESCLLMIGFSYPERYPVLVERVLASYGTIDENVLQSIIQAPASRESNLHNAIFQPSALKVWIAHAGPQGEPAYSQPYLPFSLTDLLK